MTKFRTLGRPKFKKSTTKPTQTKAEPEPSSDASASGPHRIYGNAHSDKPVLPSLSEVGNGGLGLDTTEDTTAEGATQQLFETVAVQYEEAEHQHTQTTDEPEPSSDTSTASSHIVDHIHDSSSDRPSQRKYRVGGYGGLGPDPYTDPTAQAARQQLFGNAANRYQQRQQPQPPPRHSSLAGTRDAYQSSYGVYRGSGGNGTYDDRQLTQEEQEEEDIQATKDEIRFIKQHDVSSTRNTLRLAQQAEQTGQQTLSRLDEQSERLYNAERNLDLVASHNRSAKQELSELKKV